MRYTKTVTISTAKELDSLKVGQWFKFGQFGHPSQYMGTTLGGKDISRSGKFSKSNAIRNKLQRQYAKMLGAK